METQSATPVQQPANSDQVPGVNQHGRHHWSESTCCGATTGVLPGALLIVDDHAMSRQALRVLFAADGIHNIVEAVDCEEAVQAVQDHDVAVVLLDLNLQQETGMDVLLCIKAMPSPPRVLIHSFHDGASLLSRYFHAAADGYLVKGTNRDVLLQAVYQAALGEDVWTTEQLQQIRMSDACCGTAR